MVARGIGGPDLQVTELNEHDQELRRRWKRELDQFGVENVRIALSGNVHIPNVDRAYAWEWLRQQDAERRMGDKRIAAWTLAASVIAAIAGIVAAVAAVVGLKWAN
jgi:hypothetical protein